MAKNKMSSHIELVDAEYKIVCEKLKELDRRNSPSGQSYVVKLSDNWLKNANTSDDDALLDRIQGIAHKAYLGNVNGEKGPHAIFSDRVGLK